MSFRCFMCHSVRHLQHQCIRPRFTQNKAKKVWVGKSRNDKDFASTSSDQSDVKVAVGNSSEGMKKEEFSSIEMFPGKSPLVSFGPKISISHVDASEVPSPLLFVNYLALILFL